MNAADDIIEKAFHEWWSNDGRYRSGPKENCHRAWTRAWRAGAEDIPHATEWLRLHQPETHAAWLAGTLTPAQVDWIAGWDACRAAVCGEHAAAPAATPQEPPDRMTFVGAMLAAASAPAIPAQPEQAPDLAGLIDRLLVLAENAHSPALTELADLMRAALASTTPPAQPEQAPSVVAALRELVELKDLKESLPDLAAKASATPWLKAQEDYERRKPLAWEAARAALASTPPTTEAGHEHSHQHSDPDRQPGSAGAQPQALHGNPEGQESGRQDEALKADDELPPLPEPAAEARWWLQNAFNATELSLLRKHPEVEKYWENRDKLSLFTPDQMRAYARSARKQAIKWPRNQDLFLRDDMGMGQLRVLLDGDADVIIAIWPQEGPSVSLEFCTSGNGGGKSPNVRAALIALMNAMEQDGATPRPDGAR